ncbi:MAG TPA: cytochrome c3 family protein [Candidatus Elarobacter sp.]|nr:cytochrome c3 family protein [Candidatus Elarobacter sp.]
MPGREITRSLVLMLLVLGLVRPGTAESRKHGNDTATSADAQDSKSSSGQQKDNKLAETHVAVDSSQYVGAETCKTCHEEQAKSYDQGPHWKTTLDKHKGVEYQGCEACHGPGKEHAESADPAKIIRFGGLSREESSKRCLTCHEFGAEHSNFLRSQHMKNNVGCVDCHSVHSPKVNRELLRAAQPTLCYSCHLEVKPDFSNPFIIA